MRLETIPQLGDDPTVSLPAPGGLTIRPLTAANRQPLLEQPPI